MMSAKYDLRKNYKWCYLTQDVRDFKKGETVYPKLLRIDLTNKCNYSCPDCLYRNKHNSPLSKDDTYEINLNLELEINKLLTNLHKFIGLGLKSVIITGGGEPFLYNKIFYLLKFLDKKGIKIGIITNGSFDKTYAKKLTKIKNLKWIRFSIDAAFSKTYSTIHGTYPKNFYRVLTNIKNLTNVKNKRYVVGGNFVVSPVNMEEMTDFYYLAKKLNLNNIRYTPLYTRNNETVFNDNQLLKVRKILKKIKELSKRENFNVKITKRFYNFLTPNKTRRCYFSLFSLNLGTDNKIYPCCLKKYIPRFGISLESTDVKRAIEKRLYFIKNFDAKDCEQCMYKDFNEFLDFFQKLSDFDEDFIP